MSRRHTLQDMADRCRICLANQGCMTSLRDDRVRIKLKDLTKCTCIDIKHDENLPGIVCHVCLYKLNMWSEFKRRFVQSNEILLEQLEVSEEVSDDANKSSLVDEALEKHLAQAANRKRLHRSDEDSILDRNKKKSKVDVESLLELTNIETDKTMYISDNNNAALSKDPSHNVTDNIKQTKEAENSREGNRQSSLLMRTRLLSGRRGRAIERRKAFTKRWVERKKALLAATGENVSDTDSVGSDDTQLSPVQKARAKTNADKEEAEKQKKIARLLKSLKIDLTEKYIPIRNREHIVIGDTDSDTRRTRLNTNSLLKQQTDNKDVVNRNGASSQENSIGKEATVKNERAKKSQSRADTFVPSSMKSELVIGDTTYVVTMILSESQLGQENSDKIDDNSPEKNTDIIDAVQLRRVHPIVNTNKKKEFVERCLNIEVEGTELETLKRVQDELLDFIEKEMKQKLVADDAAKTDKMTEADIRSIQKLDEQLKAIIEKTIKNNVESSVRDAVDAKARSQRSTRLSPALLKTAMNSSKYQPKVIVKRLDIAKESKLFKINNVHVLKQAAPKNKLAGPFSATSRKRQSILPKRYNDYNTSALDSDFEPDNERMPETPRVKNPILRTYGSSTAKHLPGTSNSVVSRRIDTLADKTADSGNVTSISLSTGQDSAAATVTAMATMTAMATVAAEVVASKQKPDYEKTIKIEEAIAENHICGVCGNSFNSRKDVEVHVQTHKANNTEVTMTSAPSQQVQKPKMMRCKRCQEIVEARFVKGHSCKMLTHAHKCYVCNSTFRTEKLLVRHLESHDQSEFNIENVTKIESKKSPNETESKKSPSPVPASPEKEQQSSQKTETKVQNVLTEKNDIQSDKVSSTGVKLDGADNVDKSKETYTCFVCDKIFTDKEILKDHLQKHCDDLSEGEQSNSKEQFQCAICGDTLESDQALEEHVGKHLFNDEDDNPNLISIEDQESQKLKGNSAAYCCGQCFETFDSEMSLEMHMQAHEEDAAIAEWEKKSMDITPYQCMLCGEIIDTEEELNEHLDVMHNIRNGQICQLCDTAFRTLEDLQEHVATH